MRHTKLTLPGPEMSPKPDIHAQSEQPSPGCKQAQWVMHSGQGSAATAIPYCIAAAEPARRLIELTAPA